jgi:arylsulfatase A-like enzyme
MATELRPKLAKVADPRKQMALMAKYLFNTKGFGLPRSETILPERLKTVGYATGMFGKWHVGYKPELTPPQRGFDEFLGFLSGANNYLPDARRDVRRNPILRGATPVEEREYLTDAFGREAAAFIDKHKDEPFFLYLPFNAVHSPLEAIEKYLKRFPEVELFRIDDVFGGWQKAQKEYFDDGGVFDQVYKP